MSADSTVRWSAGDCSVLTEAAIRKLGTCGWLCIHHSYGFRISDHSGIALAQEARRLEEKPRLTKRDDGEKAMIGFHGTNATIASRLQAGGVDVATGGGELGRGFYTGQYLWAAKAWAFGRFSERQKNVVEFNVPDPEIDRLHVEIRDGASATLIRSNLRRSGTTRTYLFGCDMLWTPIVGKANITCDQHKWESDQSQILLNGPTVGRTVR